MKKVAKLRKKGRLIPLGEFTVGEMHEAMRLNASGVQTTKKADKYYKKRIKFWEMKIKAWEKKEAKRKKLLKSLKKKK